MIIINICILYFKHITHTDDFTVNGYPASLVNAHISAHTLKCQVKDPSSYVLQQMDAV